MAYLVIILAVLFVIILAYDKGCMLDDIVKQTRKKGKGRLTCF